MLSRELTCTRQCETGYKAIPRQGFMAGTSILAFGLVVGGLGGRTYLGRGGRTSECSSPPDPRVCSPRLKALNPPAFSGRDCYPPLLLMWTMGSCNEALDEVAASPARSASHFGSLLCITKVWGPSRWSPAHPSPSCLL